MSQQLKAQIGKLLVTGRINHYWATELLDWIVPFRIIPSKKEQATLPEIDFIIIQRTLYSYAALKKRLPAIENYDVVAASRHEIADVAKLFTLDDQKDILALLDRRMK